MRRLARLRRVAVLMAPIGAGESGKSTVLKQMRVIHAGGFSKSERKQWRVVIFNNLINAFEIIFSAMTEQALPFDNPECSVRTQWFRAARLAKADIAQPELRRARQP